VRRDEVVLAGTTGTAPVRARVEADMTSVNRKTAGVMAAGAAAVAIAVGASVAAQADTPTPTPTPTPTTSSAPGKSGTAPGQQAKPGQGKGNNGNGRGWGPGGRHGMGGFGGMGRFGPGGDVAALAQKLGVDETRLRTALDAVRDELRVERKANRAQGAPKPGVLSDDFASKLGKQLGISADKVKTAISDLRAAAEASRQQAFSDRLDQAVKDGKLTRAEADAVRKAAKLGLVGMGGKG
jgi:hypothetical protein